MCFDPFFEETGLVIGEGERSEGVEPVFSPAVNVSSDDKDKDVAGSFRRRKNKLGRRSFSRYIKAVLFDTSLMKKMRSDKSKPQKIFKSKSLNNISLMNNNNKDNFSIESFTSSSSLCTTTDSSSTTTSRCSSLSQSVENSMQVKLGNYGNGSKGCNGFNVGICLFLISLLVLVIWG